jgi:hypothetical protein
MYLNCLSPNLLPCLPHFVTEKLAHDGRAALSCQIRLVGDSDWGEEGGGGTAQRCGSEGTTALPAPELGFGVGGGGGAGVMGGAGGGKVSEKNPKVAGGQRRSRGRRRPRGTWRLPRPDVHLVTLFVNVACLWF